MSLMGRHDVSLTDARARLPGLILRVQDPRSYVLLTKHGKPVAGLVSMAEMRRIWADLDREDAERPPRIPHGLLRAPDGQLRTPREAAEQVRKLQLDRKRERAVLEAGGLEVVEGGEVAERDAWFGTAGSATERKRRWWWPFG